MLTAIVVNHNARHFLRGCLDSVLDQDLPVDRVLFVDSGSTDGSVAFVRNCYHQVEVISMRENVGYARAANLGIARADTACVLILNPDMILERSYVRLGCLALERYPQAAGVTGKIYKYDPDRDAKTMLVDSVGLAARPWRRFLDEGAALEDRGQFGVEREVFGISGNCMLLRREALRDAQVDGEIFDEDFFCYKEDVDLCWRLRLRGWSFVYTPEAIAHHVRGTGVIDRRRPLAALRARKGLNGIQKYYSYKNHRLMMLKNENVENVIVSLGPLLVRELASFVWLGLVEPRTLTSLTELAAQVPRMLRKRRAIMARQVVSPHEVRTWLEGRCPAAAAEAPRWN